MTVVIIGVDPGKSCGLAMLVDGDLSFTWQGTGDQAVTWLRSLIVQAPITYGSDVTLTVVCERYVERKGPNAVKTNQTDALELIGAITNLCAEFDVPFILQNPADAKAIAPNERLRRLRLWVVPSQLIGYPKDADDARDAIRHCVLRLATKHASIFSRLLREAGE